MLKKIIYLIDWGKLKKLGDNKIVKSSYIWLVLVPVAAKFFERLEDPLKLKFAEASLEFSLQLPFSWMVFYFSAISFSVANLFYIWRCPTIVKQFNSYSDFEKEGRIAGEILDFYEKLDYKKSADYELIKKEIYDVISQENSLKSAIGVGKDQVIIQKADIFWRVRNLALEAFPYPRWFCASFYGIGLSLITWVLIQNLIFVLRSF